MGYKFGCPYCGSTNITEVWWQGYTAPVTRWSATGEAEDYGERRSIDAIKEWEDSERFHCPECDSTFDTPKLLSGGPTPGPWQIVGDRIEGPPVACRRPVPAQIVAVVRGDSGGDYDLYSQKIAAANRRAIQKVPEMLDLARDMEDLLTGYDELIPTEKDILARCQELLKEIENDA